ncbi:YrhB domain-containing protein [Streptomyces sp. NPDC060194]|uniref:YrhB domain-containing protein n=1 Tax=Streptomyces sp. NPDC060194 TaxID=3347069 RepID=UPI003657704B
MIGREAAVRTVEAELEREYERRREAGVDAIREVVTHVEEHELAWIVAYQSEEFVRTGDWQHALAGNGPYLVDRVDGGLHAIGVLSWMSGDWEADYRARIRGLPVRTAVDDLLDAAREECAARGRLSAARLLRRRLPALSPVQAVEYATALAAGTVPEPLVAAATCALVKPLSPVYAVHTIQPGHAGGATAGG